MQIEVNLWAVLVAAIASMVIGSVWHGPLFGNRYMQAMGMDSWSEEKKAEMKKCMKQAYVWQFIASLLMIYVLACFMWLTNQMTILGGLTVAFWAWIGFVVPVKLSEALWGGKMILFWIGIGNMLVTLLVAGAIVGAWQ